MLDKRNERRIHHGRDVCRPDRRAGRKAIQAAKPNDRSDRDRVYAILITDLEKVQALAQMHEI